MICKKRRYDRIGAMYALANIKSPFSSMKRNEKRYYYCKSCNAYHLTSKDKNEK